MENEVKRKSGAITLGIGAILILLSFTGLWPLFLIGFLCFLVGLGLLYSGLSSRNRGLLLIAIGFFPAILSLVIILMVIPIAWLDLKIAFIFLFELFWALLFFIPGIIRIRTETKFSEGSVYLYSLAPLTIFWGLICELIISAVTSSSNPTKVFRDVFFQSFLACMGIGFLLSLLTIVFAYFKVYF